MGTPEESPCLQRRSAWPHDASAPWSCSVSRSVLSKESFLSTLMFAFFHSQFCFLCSMSGCWNNLFFIRAFNSWDVTKTIFSAASVLVPWPVCPWASCNHNFSGKWSFITFAAHKVQVLRRILLFFLKEAVDLEYSLCFPSGHICSSTAPRLQNRHTSRFHQL